ncbi:hypothetical protein RQN9TF_18675 [Rhodococcus qingshengii]|nr:hypothetical protein RQN9TF_18675 [Rhodococcus qingshengii]
MGPPLREVHDPRRHALGMQAQTQDVHRWFQEEISGARGQNSHGLVPGDHLPLLIDHHGRIRVMRVDDAIDGLTHR